MMVYLGSTAKKKLLFFMLTLTLIRASLPAVPAKAIDERSSHSSACPAPTLKLTGDWKVNVAVANSIGESVTLSVTPPPILSVTDEEYASLPVFDPSASGWAKGARLRGLIAQECTTPHLLEPESVQLRAGTGAEATLLTPDKDYAVDPVWGTFGRLPNGGIKEGQAVFASYRFGQLRIDSIVQAHDGRLSVREGKPTSAAPFPPEMKPGELRLANIWLPGRIARLGAENLFPIQEDAYPEPPKPRPTVAERLLPRTLMKLREGRPLRVLAWGDSVTDGTYLANTERDRWQAQFVTRLRERFPSAKIELVTEAWSAHNTGSYLAEPPGSPHNYAEKVLAAKPDLVVSEFVNDAGLTPEQVQERYGKLWADFQGIGVEWIILTPHYVRPDWMGLTKERDIDDDPRPYVKGLREFASRHPVALADASLRYGRLWRQGLPYSTLMVNSINHPDERGMKLFADALMELFP
jgi:lysophospholipase L1-like esterase